VARRNIQSWRGEGADDNETFDETQVKDWVMCGPPIEDYEIDQEPV